MRALQVENAHERHHMAKSSSLLGKQPQRPIGQGPWQQQRLTVRGVIVYAVKGQFP